MSVIVRYVEAAKCDLLAEDDPKKPIARAWVRFLEFHYGSRQLIESGRTDECRKLYGPEPMPGVRGDQLFLTFACCDDHRELMQLKEKIIALLEEHGFNKPVMVGDRAVHAVLSEEWWTSHGYTWNIHVPIVQFRSEIPQD